MRFTVSILILLCSVAGWAQQPPPASAVELVDVFRSGEGGYHTYRIPTIATAADGALLVFAEARKGNRGDPGSGDIDLVFRRSTDRGRTWSAMQVLDDPGENWAASNPTPLLDRTTRRLWIFYNRWEPGHGTASSKAGTTNNQVWARSSDDHGRTWSAPRDLTRQARDFDHWGAVFLGPGGAIQARNGRLLVPAAMKYDAYWVMGQVGNFTGNIETLRAYAFFSDDHGASWQRGEPAAVFTNENQLVETGGGDSILMDARQNSGDHRWLMKSTDGGKTWGRPLAGQKVTTVATGVERLDAKVLLWAGPLGPGRKHLVARLSYDDGLTFSAERTVYEGFAAYSDLTILDDGSAGVIFERGDSQGYEAVTFARLGLDILGLVK